MEKAMRFNNIAFVFVKGNDLNERKWNITKL